MLHKATHTDDQVPAGGGPGGAGVGPAVPAGVLVRPQPQGLHLSPAVRHPGPQDVPEDRLPRGRAVPGRLRRVAGRPRAVEGPALLHAQLRRAAAAKKGEFVLLLFRAATSASDRGLIGEKPTAAVDGTGLESRHTSRYFARRSGAEQATWTKLTVAVDTASHFLAGATVTTGPSNDSPQFKPVLAQASLAVDWDRVLADAAFDSEAHHCYARDELGIRSSVIGLNRRGRGRKRPKTKYRRQMARRFRKKPRGSRYRRVYGQRWQAESAISRHKRRLGSALGGKSEASRERECYLRVLTHNLMIL